MTPQLDRRRFLGLGTASSLALLATRGWAGQQCSAVYQNPALPGHQLQNCIAGVPTVNFAQAYQQRDEWCWAASISMIFNYYNHPVDQVRIVRETWGDARNMPAQPEVIMHNLNRDWRDDHGRAFRVRADVQTANNFNAVKDLIENEPLIIGSMGHATVLTGLEGTTDLTTGEWRITQAYVRDPWPGRGGRRALSEQEWMSVRFAARIRVQDA